jgi:hypothetical protein
MGGIMSSSILALDTNLANCTVANHPLGTLHFGCACHSGSPKFNELLARFESNNAKVNDLNPPKPKLGV